MGFGLGLMLQVFLLLFWLPHSFSEAPISTMQLIVHHVGDLPDNLEFFLLPSTLFLYAVLIVYSLLALQFFI